jgi:hypothetical protein
MDSRRNIGPILSIIQESVFAFVTSLSYCFPHNNKHPVEHWCTYQLFWRLVMPIQDCTEFTRTSTIKYLALDTSRLDSRPTFPNGREQLNLAYEVPNRQAYEGDVFSGDSTLREGQTHHQPARVQRLIVASRLAALRGLLWDIRAWSQQLCSTRGNFVGRQPY